MCIDAKKARCWKYSPADTHTHFPPGSTFQPNRQAVATGLSFINTLCTRSEESLPISRENNENYQITLPKRRIGFSFLDVVDQDEPKYHIRSPYELTTAIISTDEQYNDFFLLHSQFQLRAVTDSYRSSMELKIRFSNSLIQLEIASLLSLEWEKALPTSYPTGSLVLDQHAEKQNFSWDKPSPSRIQRGSVIFTTWWLKKDFAINPTYRHCLKHWKQWRFTRARMVFLLKLYKKLGCGLDQMNWQEVVKLLRNNFAYADV